MRRQAHTSLEAWASIVPSLTEMQVKVFAHFRRVAPCCDAALVAYVRASEPGISDSTIRGRRAELAKLGLIRRSGRHATLPNGRRAIIWEAQVMECGDK